MKKIIITGAVSAIAAISFAGTASAAPAGAACFGQVHKSINKDGALGLDNVGQAVKALGGQGKNATAKSLCVAAP